MMGLPEQHAASGSCPSPFGILDLPASQEQQPAVLNPDTFTHLMAAGMPQSGRSQLLRTIAGTLALSHSSADVHLYGIDCGNGALLPLAELPHCGAVVSRTQTERAARLLGARLAAELSRRQELLAAAGFASIGEQRAAAPQAERLPHVFVLLDRWEGFTTTLGELGGGQPDRDHHPAAERREPAPTCTSSRLATLVACWSAASLRAMRREAGIQARRAGGLPPGRGLQPA